MNHRDPSSDANAAQFEQRSPSKRSFGSADVIRVTIEIPPMVVVLLTLLLLAIIRG